MNDRRGNYTEKLRVSRCPFYDVEEATHIDMRLPCLGGYAEVREGNRRNNENNLHSSLIYT